jgi:arylsulfatase A-like enzyme
MNKIACAMLLTCVCLGRTAATSEDGRVQQHPNILFVIMDDVGIDQLRSFGYGGLTPPRTPVLDVVAQQGVRFRNVWAMPECSPSRAMFFEGRYPLRTNIFNAILTTDLANSQVSPFETTTPKILKSADYTSALFGKFHLAGPTNNPYGHGTPNSLGFDYFDGFLEGAPHPIDTTAGGIKVTGGSAELPTGPYTCGFVPKYLIVDHRDIGSEAGACYFPERACTIITSSSTAPAPGRSCMEQGGVFVPGEMGGDSCRATPPSQVNFNLANGYYVFNLVTNDLKSRTVDVHKLTDPRARMYSPTETTDAAVQWIKSRPANSSWMATVAYASIHAPYQQAPQSLTPGEPDLSEVACSGGSLADTRTLSNQMLEGMDTEIGRLLVEAGLASRGADGSLDYDPSASNTMVVIIGDNGTYGPGVKLPFDLTHAKGFVNQTGVWVPLIVSGPLVNAPNRTVEKMVNVADLFQLFGEIAGLNVRDLVPKARILDSVSMLPYLTNPSQPGLRAYNFTQTGINISAHNARPGPCLISIPGNVTCVQIFPQKGLCEQEGGVWYGPGSTVVPPPAYPSCCALQNANLPGLSFSILPLSQAAVRDEHFKLIQVTNENCNSTSPPPDDTTSELQLYRINEHIPFPRIDRPTGPLRNNLITDPTNPTSGLTDRQLREFNLLSQELSDILNSEVQCPGDGNVDGVVNELDLKNWAVFHHIGPPGAKGGSSWYDFNLPETDGYDGKTNHYDRKYIQENLGRTCAPR